MLLLQKHDIHGSLILCLFLCYLPEDSRKVSETWKHALILHVIYIYEGPPIDWIGGVAQAGHVEDHVDVKTLTVDLMIVCLLEQILHVSLVSGVVIVHFWRVWNIFDRFCLISFQ